MIVLRASFKTVFILAKKKITPESISSSVSRGELFLLLKQKMVIQKRDPDDKCLYSFSECPLCIKQEKAKCSVAFALTFFFGSHLSILQSAKINLILS